MQTMIFDNHNFTLFAFVEIVGHDDSLPYTASLKMDDVVFAKGMNDGWGGETNITIINQEVYDKATEILANHKDEYGFVYNVSYLMDILACREADNDNLQKYIMNNQRTKLIFQTKDNQIIYVKFKTKLSLRKIMETENGRNMILKTISEYERKGNKLLNTNIKLK